MTCSFCGQPTPAGSRCPCTWDAETHTYRRKDVSDPAPHVTVSWLDPDSGVFARIIRYGERSFVLWWTDGGPNDWTEEFESEAVALLRLACLVRCVELDETVVGGFFARREDAFAEHAETFLSQEVR